MGKRGEQMKQLYVKGRQLGKTGMALVQFVRDELKKLKKA